MKVLTIEEMKREEQLSNEMGITFQRLMENAGCAAAAYVKKRQIDVSGRNAVIFCGSGNNGGDGFVVTRKLFEEKANVAAVLVCGMPKTDEAIYMYRRLVSAGITILSFENDYDSVRKFTEKADILIDAVFGTGFRGKLSGAGLAAADLINESAAVKYALDIPSGVNASAGTVSEGSVRADYTVAFEALKPGHLILPGKEYCGCTDDVDIGIPHEVRKTVIPRGVITDDDMVFSSIKKRPLDSNKGTYGKLLCVVGSREYPGAAAMSVMGALRTGAGITTVVTTERVESMILSRVPEATFYTLPENTNGRMDISDFTVREKFGEMLKKADAVLIGCGIGRGEDADSLVEYVLRMSECTVILDADALYSISRHPEYMLLANRTPIMTPHMGEMARICGKTAQEVSERRIEYADDISKGMRSVVVLKDSTTVISAPNGDIYFNTTGNPGLSKGGSGDVLAGIISSLSAQGFIETASAVCGAYIHGKAADMAAAELSQYGILPTDIPKYMCRVFSAHGL